MIRLSRHVLISSFIVFSVSSLAAIPLKNKNQETLEILELPTANRDRIIQEKSKEFYPTLQKIAFSEEFSMRSRWHAIMSMAKTKDARVKNDLLKAAEHKEWFMRNASLVAFKLYKPDMLQTVARKLIQDNALVVRSAAVEALDDSLDSRKILWRELSTSYNFRRGQSLWIRGQITKILAHDPRSYEVPRFAELLKDKDAQIPQYAVLALEKVTNQKMGDAKLSLSAKRQLWIKHFAQADFSK